MKFVAQVVMMTALAAPMTSFAQSQAPKKADQKAAPKEATDVVCGMTVDPKTAEKSEYKGKTYYFCSVDDKKQFDKSPEKYLAKDDGKKK
jgi:YHS domain-containing protein